MTTPASTPARDNIRRGLLPEILWADSGDLASALQAPTDADAMSLVAREGIPHGTLGGRTFVRREALLAWLASREGRRS